MDNPITILNDEFIKLSFSWALCIKQFACIIPALVAYVSVHVISGWLQDDRHNEESNYLAPKLDINTLDYIKQREERERIRQDQDEWRAQQQEREREERIAERKRKIDSALFNRNESTVSRSCPSCGASYGTGKVCQYCGQP